MKNKSEKYVLISSALAILLSVFMLVGLTFAWFSDQAQTNVKPIQSGTLDIALEDADGNDLTGKTLEWVKNEGQTNILWEPGCTYTLPEIKVVNKGSLALKYNFSVSGVDGDEKLLEALSFKALINGKEFELSGVNGKLLAGEKATVVIRGSMNETAGNEYQGLSVNGVSIQVTATQVDNTENLGYTSSSGGLKAESTTNQVVSNENLGSTPAYTIEKGNTERFNLSNETVNAQSIVVANESAVEITISNVTATVQDAVVLNAANTVTIKNCNINLPKGGMLVKNNSQGKVTLIILDVTVNGVKLDKTTVNQCISNVSDVTVVG